MFHHPYKSGSTSKHTDQGNLLRGQACTNCRRRKIRCDGNKPVCGQCIRATKTQHPCEYVDATRTKTQILEDTIADLEARIQDLEQSEAGPSTAPAIAFHPPPDQQRPSGPLLHPTLTLGVEHSSTAPPTSSGELSNLHFLEPLLTVATGSSPSSAPQTERSPGEQIEEPSAVEIQTLVDNFLNHAAEFGFFLDRQRFRQSALLPLPIGDQSRPAPALLGAVYLLGRSLSRASGFSLDEQSYLMSSLRLTSTATIDTHPLRIMHKLQAEVLLSNYFFRNGRFLEARRHASIACTLTVACGLHTVELATGSAVVNDTGEATLPILDPPRDNIELGERISAFWTVYSLHNVWSAILGSPISLAFTVTNQANVPWSLQTATLEQPLAFQGNNVIQNFLINGEDNGSGGTTLPALLAKSALLYERSANLASRFLSGDPLNADDMTAEFHSLDLLAENVRNQLPTLGQLSVTNAFLCRSVVVAHALLNATVIKLHSLFMHQNAASSQRCLASAEAMIRFANDQNILQLGVINPIMAMLWPTACQIIVDEIARLRVVRRENLHQGIISEREAQLVQAMEIGIQIMGVFARDSPSMGMELTKVQIAYASVEI